MPAAPPRAKALAPGVPLCLLAMFGFTWPLLLALDLTEGIIPKQFLVEFGKNKSKHCFEVV